MGGGVGVPPPPPARAGVLKVEKWRWKSGGGLSGRRGRQVRARRGVRRCRRGSARCRGSRPSRRRGWGRRGRAPWWPRRARAAPDAGVSPSLPCAAHRAARARSTLRALASRTAGTRRSSTGRRSVSPNPPQPPYPNQHRGVGGGVGGGCTPDSPRNCRAREGLRGLHLARVRNASSPVPRATAWASSQ